MSASKAALVLATAAVAHSANAQVPFVGSDGKQSGISYGKNDIFFTFGDKKKVSLSGAWRSKGLLQQLLIEGTSNDEGFSKIFSGDGGVLGNGRIAFTLAWDSSKVGEAPKEFKGEFEDLWVAPSLIKELILTNRMVDALQVTSTPTSNQAKSTHPLPDNTRRELLSILENLRKKTVSASLTDLRSVFAEDSIKVALRLLSLGQPKQTGASADLHVTADKELVAKLIVRLVGPSTASSSPSNLVEGLTDYVYHLNAHPSGDFRSSFLLTLPPANGDLTDLENKVKDNFDSVKAVAAKLFTDSRGDLDINQDLEYRSSVFQSVLKLEAALLLTADQKEKSNQLTKIRTEVFKKIDDAQFEAAKRWANSLLTLKPVQFYVQKGLRFGLGSGVYDRYDLARPSGSRFYQSNFQLPEVSGYYALITENGRLSFSAGYSEVVDDSDAVKRTFKTTDTITDPDTGAVSDYTKTTEAYVGNIRKSINRPIAASYTTWPGGLSQQVGLSFSVESSWDGFDEVVPRFTAFLSRKNSPTDVIGGISLAYIDKSPTFSLVTSLKF